MGTLLIWILAGVAGLSIAAVVRVWLTNRLRWRGTRIVECPENHVTAAVEVDAARAAATALRGAQQIQLRSCSRWPEKAGCAQDCLREIETAPAECAARTMIERWYSGTRCVLCAKPFDEIDWTLHEPGVLRPDGHTVAGWRDVAMDTLPVVLETHTPVCWDCLIVESVLQKHPERVTMRPPHRSPGVPGPLPPARA